MSGRKGSAAQAVFDTVELLEAILVDVDMQTLLLSQRVNKQFKATVEGSDLLQQALFLRLATKCGERFGSDGVNILLEGCEIRQDGASIKLDQIKDDHKIFPKLTFVDIHGIGQKGLEKMLCGSWAKMQLVHAPNLCEDGKLSIVEQGWAHLDVELYDLPVAATMGDLVLQAYKQATDEDAFHYEMRLDYDECAEIDEMMEEDLDDFF